jgi:hypothetical protein
VRLYADRGPTRVALAVAALALLALAIWAALPLLRRPLR